MPSNGYILFNTSAIKQCAVKNARDDSFKICLRGASTRPDFERHKEYATRAALTWLKLYRMLDYSVTTKVVLSCEQPAIVVNVLNGSGRSYAQPSQAWLYAEVNQSTWVHEFLHAMAGLGDTYQGSTACQCRSGQPISNACCGGYGARADHTKWSGFYPDDVEGATRAYRIAHGEGTIPTMRDPEFSLFGPIDLASPFYGLNIGEDTQEYAIESHQVQILQGEWLTPINWNAEFE